MLAALAVAAGNALVQAAVTDGWPGLRSRVVRLFGRGDLDQQIARRLDATRAELMAAPPDQADTVRSRLASQWETRFGDLLDNFPDAERELANLVEDLKAAAPVTAAGGSVAADRAVNIGATDGSMAAGIFQGSVTLPAARPPVASPPDPTMPGLRRG
jgi:hypothetical protein